MEKWMLHEISCSTHGCRCKILRKSHDGMWRFSTKVIKSEDDGTGVVAICKSCGKENRLELQLSIPASPLPQQELKKGFTVVETKKS